jgi:hypothetical protein
MNPLNHPVPADGSPSFAPATRTGALFLVSVLGLFLELLLIRWVGTEIRIFAYLQNTVLVVCFLGLGMGCWTCRRPVKARDVLRPLAALVLLLAVPLTRRWLGMISERLSVIHLIWRPAVATGPWQAALDVALGLALTGGLMLLLWQTFVPVGRLMGRLLDEHPRTILAYSVNVGGSLIGIWLFALLSAWYLPPPAWFAVAAALVLLLAALSRALAVLDLLLLAGVVALAWVAGLQPGSLETAWSPYQKLVLRPADPATEVGDYVINVNNTGYQAMVDLRPETVAADPRRFPPEQRGLSQYDIPLLLHPAPRRFLVVGAGSGNDAAGGLRNGAEEVVAVEIDPAIISLGRRYHPERPYDSPRVRVVNDDARSYFATTAERFDVIAFGLLDSHTTTAMTNARLDHYVYTVESLRRARELLAPGGVMVLSFEAQKPFIADRMARGLGEVFGQRPLCFRVPFNGYGWGGVLFVAGDLDQAHRQLAANPRLRSLITRWRRDLPVALAGTTAPATDDWPYLYLESPRVPVLYYLLAGLLLALFLGGAWRLKAPALVTGWRRPQWHFFFLGAAFMLLEVQNISKAAVVLGNTWQVNAVIISAILVLILVANWAASRFPRLPTGPVYGLLIATCLALYALDVARFGSLPFPAKAAVVGGLTSLPMLFSGIVFIRSFAGVAAKDLALGANLFGALVGGLLQAVTFVTGIKALLLLVAALYLAAWLTRPRVPAAAPMAGPPEPLPVSATA